MFDCAEGGCTTASGFASPVTGLIQRETCLSPSLHRYVMYFPSGVQAGLAVDALGEQRLFRAGTVRGLGANVNLSPAFRDRCGKHQRIAVGRPRRLWK